MAVGNVLHRDRNCDYRAGIVENRRQRHSYIHRSAAFAQADGFVLFSFTILTQASKTLSKLGASFEWHQQVGIASDGFIRGVAKEPGSPWIPTAYIQLRQNDTEN